MSGTTSPPHHEQINLDTMEEEQDLSQFNSEVDNSDALRRAPSPFSPLVDYDEEFEEDQIRDGSNTVENEPNPPPAMVESLDLWLQDAKLTQEDTGIILNNVTQVREAPSSTLSKVGNRTDDKGPNPTREPERGRPDQLTEKKESSQIDRTPGYRVGNRTDDKGPNPIPRLAGQSFPQEESSEPLTTILNTSAQTSHSIREHRDTHKRPKGMAWLSSREFSTDHTLETHMREWEGGNDGQNPADQLTDCTDTDTSTDTETNIYTLLDE